MDLLTSPDARQHFDTARRLMAEGRPAAAAVALRLANAAETDARALPLELERGAAVLTCRDCPAQLATAGAAGELEHHADGSHSFDPAGALAVAR